MVRVIGIGAQLKYVIDYLNYCQYSENLITIYDPVGEQVGNKIGAFIIREFQNREIQKNDSVILCLRDNELKREIIQSLDSKNVNFLTISHPDSSISNLSEIGRGCIINRGVLVEAFSKIGDFSIVHAGCVIEHDCQIGRFCNLGPGVIMAGHSKIGDNVQLNSGVILVPSVRIGEGSIVGAGSLVLHDLPERVIAYGSPASVQRDI